MASFMPIKQFKFSTSAKEQDIDSNGYSKLSEMLDFDSDQVVAAKIEANGSGNRNVLTLSVLATESNPIPGWVARFMGNNGNDCPRIAEFMVTLLSKEGAPLSSVTFHNPAIVSIEMEVGKTMDGYLTSDVTIESNYGLEVKDLKQETAESIIEESLFLKAIKYNIETRGIVRFKVLDTAQHLLDYGRVELKGLLKSNPPLVDLDTRTVVEGLFNDYGYWESKGIPFDAATKALSNWIADRKHGSKRDPNEPWSFSELDSYYKPRTRQQAAHDSESKYVLFGGAMGGGKSHWLCAEAINFAMSEPKSKIAIVKEKRVNLPKTIMVTFFNICPPSIIESYNKSNLTVTFVNGSELSFIAADREVDRNLECFGGLRFDWIGICEADELDRYTFSALDNCLLPRRVGDSRSNKRFMSITSHSLDNWLASIFNKQGDHGDVGLYLSLRHDQFKSDEEHINSMLLSWIKRERK